MAPKDKDKTTSEAKQTEVEDYEDEAEDNAK